jgi:hypothetical protein
MNNNRMNLLPIPIRAKLLRLNQWKGAEWPNAPDSKSEAFKLRKVQNVLSQRVLKIALFLQS